MVQSPDFGDLQQVEVTTVNPLTGKAETEATAWGFNGKTWQLIGYQIARRGALLRHDADPTPVEMGVAVIEPGTPRPRSLRKRDRPQIV